MARTHIVEMGGCGSAALVSRLDWAGSSSNGRILAHRHRPKKSNKPSAKGSLQPVSKSDLSWNDSYASWSLPGIPNAITLLTFVMGAVLIQVQVRLEEEFLRKSHGEEYSVYCRRVRRWF